MPVGISPGTGPNGIAVNATTNKTYVANYGSGTVSVIDGNNNYAVHSVLVGNGPDDIAVNETTDTTYVTNYTDNTVTAIDGATEKSSRPYRPEPGRAGWPSIRSPTGSTSPIRTAR